MGRTSPSEESGWTIEDLKLRAFTVDELCNAKCVLGEILQERGTQFPKHRFFQTDQLKEAFNNLPSSNSKTLLDYRSLVIGSRHICPNRLYLHNTFKACGIVVADVECPHQDLLLHSVPAKLAGFGTVIVASSTISDLILAAAYISGVSTVIQCDGAESVGSLAFGSRDSDSSFTTSSCEYIIGFGSSQISASKFVLTQLRRQIKIDVLAAWNHQIVICLKEAEKEKEQIESFLNQIVGLNKREKVFLIGHQSFLNTLDCKPKENVKILKVFTEENENDDEFDNGNLVVEFITKTCPSHVAIFGQECLKRQLFQELYNAKKYEGGFQEIL